MALLRSCFRVEWKEPLALEVLNPGQLFAYIKLGNFSCQKNVIKIFSQRKIIIIYKFIGGYSKPFK